MTKRIKFSLITLFTAMVLFFAGLFAMTIPTKTASAATQTTLSNFSIGGTNTQNHVQLVANSGEMPEDFVTYAQSNNLAMIGTNGSTFGTTSTWRENTKWWGIVGVLAADSKTFNIFPPSGQAVLGDHLMIPQGAVIATATDSVTFGEQVDLWYNGASWQMTEPVVLTDFTFGVNNGAGYFDIVPTSGSIPAAIVSSGANLSTAGGTFGSSSTWTRDGGATTVKFPGQVGVLASTAQNFQIFPSATTAQAGDVITIPEGATVVVNGYSVVFGEAITVTFNGIKWEGLPEYEAPSTPMTISKIESNSTYDGSMYQLYVTVDVTATGTWKGWDNYATVVLNGTETKADGWCFNSTHSLYVQLTTSEVANPLTLAKGTIVTIDNVRYKIANDFNIYYYNGGLHTEPKPETMVISDFDFGAINRADRVDLVIKDSVLPNDFVTYGAGNNLSYAGGTFGTTATWNTSKFKGNVGVLSDTATSFQIFPSSATAQAGDVLTIPKGATIEANGCIVEFGVEVVLTFDGTKWSGVEEIVPATPMTITRFSSSRTVYKDGTYQIYVYTDITNNGATWGGWDNSANVLLNGTATRADWCFANTGASALLYVQVATTEVANPITIAKGTQVTINGILYEISADFNIYHYDDAFHTEAKTIPMTLTEIDTTRTIYGSEMYQLYFYTNVTNSGATWGGWDNSTNVSLNGTATRADWCFANTGANSLLYVQVTTTEVANPITIAKGTQVTINGILYEISADFNIYHYNDAFHTEPKPASTLITLGALQSNSKFDGNQYALYISVNVTAAATWAGWDNSAKVNLNGVETKADGWCFSDVSVLYVQVTSSQISQPLTIAKGTLLTINGTLYEVANDFSVSYYKVTKTVNGETTTEYANGSYTLPEFSADGYFPLGWKYNGGLYEIGDTFAAAKDGFVLEAVCVDFTQLEGASIKMGNTTEGSGIRFTARLGATNQYITKMGVLVMPSDLMTNGEFTHANYSVYDEASKTGICHEFIANSNDLGLENFQNKGKAYYVKGSVVNLFESNYQRTFVGRSFLVVNFADGEKYVYVDYDASKHERRICDVAKAALEDTKATYTTEQKKILLSYTVEELTSYAYFGPKSTDDFANYKNTGMDVVWLDMVAYRYHERYQTSWTAEQEAYMYNNATNPSLDLKGAFAAARAQGLKVIVYDQGIRRLSESKIPLVATDLANPQLLGLWLQTGDGATAEILGEAANENYFDEANMTYTYNGSNYAGANKAKVLKYMYQFESEAALKNYIATFMSQYAQESNFYGVMLADEPTEDMYEQLALVKKIIAELYPNAYTQSCQFPSYHYDSYSEFKTVLEDYASKIEGYGDLGLDFYPFLDEDISIWDQIFGKDTETENGVRINWLATMQYVAQTAAKYNLDFENTVQSHGMSDGYASVTAAELALQVHLSLAFGADKISYFTYNQHDEGGLTMTQYINNDATLKAAVTAANKNGDYLKRYMTGFEYSKSKIFGASSNCLNVDNFTQSDLTKSIIASASNSVLVNEFYNEITGEYGYYIVNITIPDNNNSVTVNLAGAATVYQNGESSSASNVTLAAGEGVFIVVSQ